MYFRYDWPQAPVSKGTCTRISETPSRKNRRFPLKAVFTALILGAIMTGGSGLSATHQACTQTHILD